MMISRRKCTLTFLFSASSSLMMMMMIIVVEAAAEEESVRDLPPLLNSADISYFFERNEMEDLHWALSQVFHQSQRMMTGSATIENDSELPLQLVSRGGGSTYTTAYKLQMDLEQAEYLAQHLPDEAQAAMFRDQVIPVYKQVLGRIPPLQMLERTEGLYAFRPLDYEAGIASVYNKALHLTDFDTLRDENGAPLPLLNSKLDTHKIEQEWFGREDPSSSSASTSPGIVVVDDILSARALERIRQLLLESTVWYQTKAPLKFGGYVGAYIDDGLYDYILLELAKELSHALPRILDGHALKYLWAYRYDSDYSGIHTHADEAAVNVNLWLTPDAANLDPTSGGLVVFTAKPPGDWDFRKYNTDTDFVREALLKPTNYANVTIPYKQNRAVLFDSALFHHTDKFSFKSGYENRRINLTLLYGNMQKSATTVKEEL